MLRRIIFTLVATLFLIGCTQSSESNVLASPLNDYDLTYTNSEWAFDVESKDLLLRNSEAVVKGYFIEQQEALMFELNPTVYTKYLFVVTESYTGELRKSSEIIVALPGGIVDKDEWVRRTNLKAEDKKFTEEVKDTSVSSSKNSSIVAQNFGSSPSLVMNPTVKTISQNSYLLYLEYNEDFSTFFTIGRQAGYKTIIDDKVYSLQTDGRSTDVFQLSQVIND